MDSKPQVIRLKDYETPNFLVPRVKLHFDLYEDHTNVKSLISFVANPKSNDSKKQVFLDGKNLDLVDIKINGTALKNTDYEVSPKGLLIKNCNDSFELETVVRLDPQNNKAFSGLYKTKTVFCTQMEAQGFSRTTFFIDRPDVLSKYTTTLTADKRLYPVLLSNGNLSAQSELKDGRHLATWEDPFPKPCYLFALVAGDLDWIEDSFLTRSKRRVDLKIFVDKGKKERARFAMNSLKQSMKWDEETYRLEYDLDIYNIVAVDDFNMGAMENKGLNIFNSKYILASPQTATDDEYLGIQAVIGHEYFHNWTGNRVTCRDWFQLSLKEGLTVFRDQEFSSDLNSRPVKRIEDVIALRTRQFPEDSGPMAHPVRPESYIAVDNFYTSTVYEKGAEVIRMLEAIVGKDMFKKGMTKYFELFDGQAVTTDDWVHAIELVSSRDFTQFKLWYSQAGTPEVCVSTKYDPENQIFEIQLIQNTLDPITHKPNKAFHIPLKLGLLSPSGAPLDYSIEGQNTNNIIELNSDKQSFYLKNVYQKPILSINREFSAPIHLNFEQSEEDLYLLLSKDTDSFNRWDSAQKLYGQFLLKNYQNELTNSPLELSEKLIQAYSDILSCGIEDPALYSKLMQLPSPQYIGQSITDINPQVLIKVYDNFYETMACRLHDQILKLYTELQSKKLGNTSIDQATRAFKNKLLDLLYRHNELTGQSLFYNHFAEAQNMTDTLAALSRLSVFAGSDYDKAMEQYYQKWHDDSLVMNKWFTIAALSSSNKCFTQIKEKIKTQAFEFTNPNKIYSLFYQFAQNNWSQFHSRNTNVYDWFADQVIKIDKLNPQVASRLGSSLNNWKKFGPEYRSGLKKALQKIIDSKPSDNLYEIASKALNH